MQILKVGVLHGKRGFTLIELTMVILVLGLAMAIITPRFGGFLERQEMRRTINAISGTVRYLQARAALTKRIYRLTFDLDKQVLSVCYFATDHVRDGQGCQAERTRELRDYELPITVRILDVVSPHGTKTREGETATHFHPTGLAEPSVIHLGTLRNQKATLVIEPFAGRVKIFDDYVEQKTG